MTVCGRINSSPEIKSEEKNLFLKYINLFLCTWLSYDCLFIKGSCALQCLCLEISLFCKQNTALKHCELRLYLQCRTGWWCTRRGRDLAPSSRILCVCVCVCAHECVQAVCVCVCWIQIYTYPLGKTSFSANILRKAFGAVRSTCMTGKGGWGDREKKTNICSKLLPPSKSIF